MIELLENERIDDLEYKGLKIIQNKDGFCFGIDSILLANFANEIKEGSTIIDLGTGTGILGILLSKKINPSKIVGVEIQKEVYEMAKRSIKLNHLEDKFEVINSNIKNLQDNVQINTFDAVITNPPYKKMGTGVINENDKKLISRHEIEASLEDFITVSYKLLKDKGSLYMVHRPDRLADIIETLRKSKLEPKKIRLVYPKEEKEANLVLIKADKNAKSFLKIEPALYVYDKKGKYTDEILRIYGKELKLKNEK